MTGIFFNPAFPQLQFAAEEISVNLPGDDTEFCSDRDFGTESGRYETRILLALNSDAETTKWLEGVDADDLPGDAGAQSYSLRTTKDGDCKTYWVLGTDIAGAMYGGLRLAEILSLGEGSKTVDEDAKPYVERRGIKFNVPLDKRMPGFNYKGDSEKGNIPHMWDITFWKEYLDELARNRFNVLSFWTKHPFTAMIRLPDYPDTEVHDVIDGYGNLVKKMSIDEKIAFWTEVMDYAVSRSIDIYFFTWNIYLNAAEGKYGLTADPKNEKTKDYVRECVKRFLITYPQITGIGVTAGEHMPGISFDGREEWLWDTYGKGIADVKKDFPARNITFIHRHWYSSVADIMGHFEEYDGRFEFSFKYAKAHVHSSPDITFADSLLEELPDGTTCWWTLRNDDIFYLRWGDPEYVRDFILNFDRHKTAGYLMGSDGYVWGRTFSYKDSSRNGTLENKKHWYEFMLWGRLGYDPELPDGLFEEHIKNRLPGVDSGLVYSAWKTASEIIPQVTRFFWRDWDFEWYPEGCKGHEFITVGDFMTGTTMEGSGIINIAEYWRMELENRQTAGLTPLDVADRLEKSASKTMDILNSFDKAAGRAVDPELMETLDDIEAHAWLGHYYSAKIRAATALAMYSSTSDDKYKDDAVRRLKEASDSWIRYADLLETHYVPVNLDRTGTMDWQDLSKHVAAEIEVAKHFQPFEIAITIKGAVEGEVYPAGTDISLELDIDSTNSLDNVLIIWNGERLGDLSEAPYIWKSTDFALLRSLTPGGYEIRIIVKDRFSNRVEKIMRFTVA